MTDLPLVRTSCQILGIRAEGCGNGCQVCLVVERVVEILTDGKRNACPVWPHIRSCLRIWGQRVWCGNRCQISPMLEAFVNSGAEGCGSGCQIHPIIQTIGNMQQMGEDMDARFTPSARQLSTWSRWMWMWMSYFAPGLSPFIRPRRRRRQLSPPHPLPTHTPLAAGPEAAQQCVHPPQKRGVEDKLCFPRNSR